MNSLGILDLSWENSHFQHPDMVQIKCSPDGSCFFHALLQAFYKPYQLQMEDGVPVSRKKLVKNFRYDLSVRLNEHTDVNDPLSPVVYQTLSRGQLEELSKEMPEYSLKGMQDELNSSSPVSNLYNEFISNELGKDIYILDSEKQDVYVTGSDLDLLYKNRQSIVLLYHPGHFDLIGLRNNDGSVSTFFDPEHPFIESIRNRLRILVKS